MNLAIFITITFHRQKNWSVGYNRKKGEEVEVVMEAHYSRHLIHTTARTNEDKKEVVRHKKSKQKVIA